MLLRRALLTLLVLACLQGAARAQESPSPEGGPPAEEVPADAPAPDAPAPADAPAPPGENGSLELQVGIYQNDDNGDGNPFLDEQETVIEPVVVFSLNVREDLTVTLTGSYDFVSSASIDRLSNYPEQSGASGDFYYGGDLALRWRATDALTLGVHGGYSTEYDYRSIALGGDVSLDLFQRNTTLSLGVNAFFDTVRVIRFDGSEEGDEGRTSFTVNLGLYQVLTPTVHMSLGYSLTLQDGFLETPFNAVVLEDPSDPPNTALDNLARGVEITEELPDTRLRHALYGQLRKYFSTGTALSVGGRFYADDWGILSATLELGVHQWLIQDVLRARLRYRYYVQTAADAFDRRLFVPPAQRANFVATRERTQDSDLGDFDAHAVGLQFTWRIVPGHQLTLGGEYVLRSDGIDQIVGLLAYRIEF